ncbi:AI-2E family transporter, partial [Klebsiella pneumoniae]
QIVSLAGECHEVLGAFVRGQLLVMLALGIIYAAGLMAIGLELGLLIGLIAGLAAIVPYMGFVIGIGAALVAGLFQFGGDLY